MRISNPLSGRRQSNRYRQSALAVVRLSNRFNPAEYSRAVERQRRSFQPILGRYTNLVSSPSCRRTPPLTTTPSELTLTRASSTENNTQYGHHMVESPTQCPAWQPRRGGWRLVGVGLVLTLGSLSRRRRRRSISDLAGAHDWTGLGLGHPVAWRGKSCVAHRHDDSGPLDHDRADRRTNGNDPFSRSHRTRLGDLLDNFFLWVLQANRSAHYRIINQCNRQPYTHSTIKAPAGTSNTYHISIGSTSTSNLTARR